MNEKHVSAKLMTETEYDDESGFWQMSDVVGTDIIKACTMYCSNSDCRLSAKTQMTTMAGVSYNYDRDGQLKVDDRNRQTVRVNCITCQKEWEVTKS